MFRLVIPTLLLAIGAACAPVYVPPSALAPLLDQAGDTHAALSAGTQGAQADVAYAMTDAAFLRVSAQGQRTAAQDNSSGNRYSRLGAGLGYFHKPQPGSALRWSLSADVGAGRSVGIASLTINGSRSTTRYSGTHINPGVQLEVGAETANAAGAFVLRPSWFHFQHDDASEGQGSDNAAFIEAYLTGRVGGETTKLQLQMGVWMPVYVPDNTAIGVPMPLVISLGLALDFPRHFYTGITGDELPLDMP